MTAGATDALHHAVQQLKQKGYKITNAPYPAVTHLVLPVPSFRPDGSIQGGGELDALLAQLPNSTTIIGGNLDHPLLNARPKIDLLQDPLYLAMNGQITAHCAVSLAATKLQYTIADSSVLVIGWGRIGKCLVQLLSSMDARVTAAVRKEKDRATLASLGIHAVNADAIDPSAYDVIFNTAPEMILPGCKGDALKIDLASKPGIDAPDVIWARGLPNLAAPKSSGKLIAETIARKVVAV